MTTLNEIYETIDKNNTFKLKVKKLVPEAVLPAKAKDSDTGYDVVAISDPEITETYVQYRTGIAIEVPEGYHVEIFPRSSISKYDLVLANSVGMIDNGYRGELLFRFKIIHRFALEPVAIVTPDLNNTQGVAKIKLLHLVKPALYQKGDKIGQIVIRKTESFPVVEVAELSSTERGAGGFGSTGT